MCSPYFSAHKNQHVAYMDEKGNVQMIEVDVIENQFNEGLKMCPFEPQTKLLDLYGAENVDTIG